MNMKGDILMELNNWKFYLFYCFIVVRGLSEYFFETEKNVQHIIKHIIHHDERFDTNINLWLSQKPIWRERNSTPTSVPGR